MKSPKPGLPALLPFEKKFCRDLGLAEEEYCLLVWAQRQVKKPPAIAKSVASGEIQAGLVPLVGLAVGILFNVAGALLAPKRKREVETPQEQRIRSESRAVSPQNNFNGVSTIVEYGTPIPLIFTNWRPDDESKGGVRVNLASVWTEVLGLSGFQTARYLGVLGEGEIVEIDPQKTAIGDQLLQNLAPLRYRAWFRNGETDDNAPRYSEEVLSSNFIPPSIPDGADPSLTPINFIGGGGVGAYYGQGYSATFIPQSAEASAQNAAPIQIKAIGGEDNTTALIDIAISPTYTANAPVVEGTTISVAIGGTEPINFPNPSGSQAKALEVQRSAGDMLYGSGTYKLGSAVWEATSVSPPGRISTDEGPIIVVMTCVRAGHYPSVAYGTQDLATGDWSMAKAVVAFSEFYYTTVTACNQVVFTIDVQSWVQVNSQSTGSIYPGSNPRDNGYNARQAFFKFHYRVVGDLNWTECPNWLAAERSSPVVNTIQIVFEDREIDFSNPPNPLRRHYEFWIEPLFDLESEAQIYSGAIPELCYLNPRTGFVEVPIDGDRSLFFPGIKVNFRDNSTAQLGRAVSLPSGEASLSYQQGPDLVVTAVSEQIQSPVAVSTYPNLAVFGIELAASRSFTSVDQISLFVKKGIRGHEIYIGEVSPTKNIAIRTFPEVLYYILRYVVNPQTGLTDFDEDTIDLPRFQIAAEFCLFNNLYFDGAIGAFQNVSELAVNHGAESLLYYARINGKHALIPMVPLACDREITTLITHAAIITDDIILNNEEGVSSWQEQTIPASDLRPIRATVVYRDNNDGNFPRARSLRVAPNPLPATIEDVTFDLSGTVCTKEHALLFGKLNVNLKRYPLTRVSFRMMPGVGFFVENLYPGAYFKLRTRFYNWERLCCGVIRSQRLWTLVPVPSGTIDGEDLSLLIYNPISGKIELASVTLGGLSGGSYPISNFVIVQCDYQPPEWFNESGPAFEPGEGPASIVPEATPADLTFYHNFPCVLGTAEVKDRTFQVETITTESDGTFSIAAILHPTDQNGESLVSYLPDDYFIIDEF